MGLDAERVATGNRQARWAARLFSLAAKHKVAMVIENPAQSMVWSLPAFVQFQRVHQSTVLDYCGFGVPWRKTTRLLSCHTDMSALGSNRCHQAALRCSFSGLPYQVLSGWCKEEHKLWTALASPYPGALAREAVKLMLK